MHNDWDENWNHRDKIPDDWYQGEDESLVKSHMLLLEMCFSKPSAIKGQKEN